MSSSQYKRVASPLSLITLSMWRGIYLLKVPTLQRRVRVFFEWSYGMFFPADIACLRYTRTQRTTKHQEKSELAQSKQLEKNS